MNIYMYGMEVERAACAHPKQRLSTGTGALDTSPAQPRRWREEQKMCAKGESNPRHSYIFGMAKLYFTTKPLARG